MFLFFQSTFANEDTFSPLAIDIFGSESLGEQVNVVKMGVTLKSCNGSLFFISKREPLTLDEGLRGKRKWQNQ